MGITCLPFYFTAQAAHALSSLNIPDTSHMNPPVFLKQRYLKRTYHKEIHIHHARRVMKRLGHL